LIDYINIWHTNFALDFGSLVDNKVNDKLFGSLSSNILLNLSTNNLLDG
jgi:hypothetical protein